MVNQYASLLLNEAGENINPENKSYFTARNYTPITLPTQLKRVHEILFPRDSSFYHRQFLCYSYLKLIEGTRSYKLFDSFDKRITYDLNKLEEYFRVARISAPISSDVNFNLLVLGSPAEEYKKNYYFETYTIKQIGSMPAICIYRDNDKVFINKDKTSSYLHGAFEIQLELAANSSTQTKEIDLGNTGLTFLINGKLSDFTHTKDKYWNFIVESPMIFEFYEIYASLKRQAGLTEDFFKHEETVADRENYGVWSRHFNSLYAFSALLNTYVDKVDRLWQKQAT